MSIYSIGKIARECFRLFCFLQIFEHSGYHASEIKNEEENPAVECGTKQPKFRFDTCGWRCKFWVTISIWEHGKWSQRVAVWVTYLGFTRRVLSPKFCYPNVQGVLGDLLDCFALWFKPLDHSFFIFPFCTTTYPAHVHFSWILSPVRASKTCTFCSKLQHACRTMLLTQNAVLWIHFINCVWTYISDHQRASVCLFSPLRWTQGRDHRHSTWALMMFLCEGETPCIFF